MKKISTHFLRAVLIFMGLAALAFCIFALPEIGPGMELEFPTVRYVGSVPWIVCAAAVPFFVVLAQAFRLLNYTDAGTAFSDRSVRALRAIKRAAAAASLILLAGMPAAFGIAQSDDAPGLVLFAFALACSPIAVAVFAAVLEKLLKSAIALQSENDLTV